MNSGIKRGFIKSDIRRSGLARMQLEESILVLRNRINKHLESLAVRFNQSEAVLLLGKKELGLFYDVLKLNLSFASHMSLDEKGFIAALWGMEICYTGKDVDLQIVVKANHSEIVDSIVGD